MYQGKSFKVATNENLTNGTLVPSPSMSNSNDLLKSDGKWTTLKFPGHANFTKTSIELNSENPTEVIYVLDATGPVSVSVSNSVIVATVSGNKIVCTCPSQRATECTLTITIGETNNYQEKVYEIHCESKFLMIYGVKWNKSYGNSKWIRTDNSADFEDPNPYYAGMDTTPSSPFDDLAPWKDLVDVERPGGTFVKIPKFYYKLNKDAEGTITLQIIEGAFATEALALGFKISPVHMDRGDGAGEKEVVYVSKYIASLVGGVAKSVPNYQVISSTYEPATHYDMEYPNVYGYNLLEENGKLKGTSSTSAHVFDYTALVTIQFLWLVEFADWNVNTCVGPPWIRSHPSNYSTLSKTGYSNTYDYHTGTTASSRSNPGLTWYRNIEGILGTYVSSIYGYGVQVTYGYSRYEQIKVTYELDDHDFSSGVYINSQYKIDNNNVTYYITDFAVSTVQGYEWCMYPCEFGNSITSIKFNTGRTSTTDLFAGKSLKFAGSITSSYVYPEEYSSIFYVQSTTDPMSSMSYPPGIYKGYAANIRLMEL